MRAFITGLAGPALTDEEREFLREAQPWGLILFKRNVTEPAALRRLIEDARTALARNAPVFIDQEGGRVQRLGPPHWPLYPPGAAYGALYERTIGRARRIERPMRRAKPLHAAALLVDKHRRIARQRGPRVFD